MARGAADFIEGTVTKPGSANNRMACRDCGLESAVSHASARECIEALQSEANRLREHLRHGRPRDTAVSQRSSDADDAGAMSPRLSPILVNL
jgi:hypothetical protein